MGVLEERVFPLRRETGGKQLLMVSRGGKGWRRSLGFEDEEEESRARTVRRRGCRGVDIVLPQVEGSRAHRALIYGSERLDLY